MPRHGPSNNPSENGTRADATHQARGKFLGIGGLVLVGVLGIRALIQKQDIFDEAHRDGAISLPQPTSRQEPLIVTPENYAEWAAKIKLPEVDIDFNAKPLTTAEAENHFLDPGIDRSRLQLFYNMYDMKKAEFDQKMDQSQNPIERQGIIINYLSTLIKAYCWATNTKQPQTMAFGSPEFVNWIGKINELLIPFGQCITQFYGPTSRLEVHGINKILPIHIDGKQITEVMVILKDRKSYYGDPQKSGDDTAIGGAYFDGAKFLIVDLEAGKKNIEKVALDLGFPKDKVPMNDIRESIVRHEVMHIIMTKKLGKANGIRHFAKKRGKINLGTYSLNEKSYTWADSLQIHELASIGFATMNSGEAANVVLMTSAFNREENCRLATMIASYELLNSRYTTPATKYKIDASLRGAQGNREDMMAILREIPPLEIRRIGEVMVKLAMHLSQPE